MNIRWKLYITAAAIIVILPVFAVVLSYNRARSISDNMMTEFSQYVGYEYSYWSFSGLKGNSSPSWVILFDDPNSYDGSVVRVQVSITGKIFQVQPSVAEIKTHLHRNMANNLKLKTEFKSEDNAENEKNRD